MNNNKSKDNKCFYVVYIYVILEIGRLRQEDCSLVVRYFFFFKKIEFKNDKDRIEIIIIIKMSG